MVTALRHRIAVIFAAAILIAASGCNSTSGLFGSSSGDSLQGNFPGCISATALDGSQISVTFQIPAGAQTMNIYRNGFLVTTVLASSNSTTYTDIGLLQATTYTYSCEGEFNGQPLMGYQTVSATTLDLSAPTFAGISSATILSSSSAQVTWPIVDPLGVVAAFYQIYANPGTAVNWTLAPRAQIGLGTQQTTLTNLGKELQYSFGVRACTASGVCDTNTTTIEGTPPPDGGAPGTPGAISVTKGSGSVILTAPWQDSDGAVMNRKVYQMTGTPTLPVTIGQFTLALTVAVNQPQYGNVSNTITLTGLADNTTYSWIVQDVDPAGNQSTNVNYVTYSTGDLTPPVFGGTTSIMLGTPPDQNIVIGFTAINREGNASGSTDPNDKNGAANYLVYTASTPCTQSGSVVTCNPAPNACTAGVQYGTPIPTTSYAPGPQTYTITGLSQRTTYSVCLKAEDAAGNISANSIASTITTTDVTPPVFNGIQTMSYNNVASTLNLTWNASTSPDTEKYIVSLWSGTTTPTAAQITTLVAGTPSAAGLAVTQAMFTMSNFQQVYAVVDSCDNAELLPNGIQNCTTNLVTPVGVGTAQTNAKELTLGSILPPQGFLGINPSLTTVGASQGTINVAWYAPSPTADWGTYAGFHIYYLDSSNNLNFLQDCTCLESPCTGVAPQDTACTVTGLSARRTYTLYVEGFDQYGNVTSYLAPPQNYTASVQTKDTAPPTFTSNLTIGASPTYKMTWTAATDNQYASEPGAVISYQLYQKAGSTFANSFKPYNDGVLRTTTQLTSYTDAGFTQGQTYYYAVCALDASNNRTCDGNVETFQVTDITPPVISSFTSTEAGNPTNHQWTLNWAATDNVTPTGNIVYTIYRTYSPTAQLATTSGTQIYTGAGTTTLASQIGALNASGYANYLLQAKDQAGNISSANLSVAYNNVITITNVQRNGGPNAGGKLIVITGTGFVTSTQAGFATGTTVTVGGTACTSPTVYNSIEMSCVVPSGTGTSDVVVTNPEGSAATLVGGYTYTFSSANICDNSGSWGASFASGNGTPGTPYVICTPQHLQNMNMAAYVANSLYFQLADNIDMTAFAWTPIGFTTPFKGFIDGKGFLVANLTYNNAANSNVGLIGQYANYTTTAYYMKNLIIGNVNLNGNQYVGGLVGDAYFSNVTVANVIVTGTVQGSTYVGGVMGFFYDNGGTISNSSFTGLVTGSSQDVGGFVGQAWGAGAYSNDWSAGTVTGLSSVGGFTGSFGDGSAALLNFTNCYSTAMVSGAGIYVGGFAGGTAWAGVGFYSSYATGNVTSSGTSAQAVGGFVGGAITATFSQCYATGNVTTTATASTTYYVGGFAGELFSGNNSVSQCYSTGSVQGAVGWAQYYGGLVGLLDDATDTITNSYSTGPVTAEYSGGLIGWNYGGTVSNSFATGAVAATSSQGGVFAANTGTITNCYFDTTTTLQTNGGPTAGGTGESDANMKVEANFSGFDFVTTPVWKMSPVTGYPELNYQTP